VNGIFMIGMYETMNAAAMIAKKLQLVLFVAAIIQHPLRYWLS
jgi:hypothetical protein